MVPAGWYTGHFWSLSVEEHFYLLFPGFLVLVRRGRLRVLLPVVLLLEAWRLYVFAHPRLWLAQVPDLRSDLTVNAILLAAAAALALQRPPVRAWAVRWLPPWAVLPLSAVVWRGIDLHRGRWSHFAVLLTCTLMIVSTMLHPRGLSGRVLESPPFRFLGRLSYSVYLWQMLFFTQSNFFSGLAPPHSALFAYVQATTPLRYAAVLLLSLLSYRWIEKPFIRLGHRLAKPAVPDRVDFQQATA